jgi:hypothetical protein
MGKDRYRTAFLIAFTAAFLASFSLTARRGPTVSPVPPLPEDSRDEDRMGRDYFEWLRLHDPATGQIPPAIRAKEVAYAATLPVRESSAGMKAKAAASLYPDWTAAGPTNIAGRVKALAFDATNSSVMLAGGVSGSMYLSTDGGSTWFSTSQPGQHFGVTCVAQDTRSGKTGTWYYGTGENKNNSEGYWGGSGSYYFGNGIYKSTDGGLDWAVLPSTVPASNYLWSNQFQFVWKIVVDPVTTAQDIVYAACWGTIQRSTDGGSTWTQVLGSGLSSATGIDLAMTSTGVLYATLNSYSSAPGIWRSTDGISWTNITPSGWPATYLMTSIGIAPSNENIVYVISYTPGAGLNGHSIWKYTYVSGNGSGAGGTWENRSANVPNFADNAGRKFDSGGGSSLMIGVKPDNPDVVFVGGVNLYRSTDGFATSVNTTWIGGFTYQGVNSPYGFWGGMLEPHHADQHSVLFQPGSPAIMYSANDGGIHRTNNDLATPVVWTEITGGLVNAQFFTAAIDHATAGNELVIGGLQDRGSFFTNAASRTAVQIDAGDGAWCAIADGRTSYYTSSQYGVTFRSIHSDDGVLHGFTRVDPLGLANQLFLASFALDPTNNARMYYAGGRILWRNNNLAGIPLSGYAQTSVNWDSLSTTRLTSGYVSAIGVSTNPAGRVYYGTTDGQVYRLDSASTGTPVPLNIWSGKGFPYSAYVGCIAVDPSNADSVLVSFSNYGVQSIFFSTNGGSAWTAVSGNLEEGGNPAGNGPSVRWLRILPLSSGRIYFAATSTGLYSTSTLNAGSTIWGQEGASSIGNAVVDMVDVRPSDGFVAAATHGLGLFVTNLPVFSVASTVQNGWNLVSVPVFPGDYRKQAIYPGAGSRAFAYQGSYLAADTLQTGAGYWVRFNSGQPVNYSGTPVSRETVAVKSQWNMIGSISSPVAVAGIASIPGGIVTSRFYGYSGAYSIADSIFPGKGYWVKVNQDGKLILSSVPSTAPSERIRIITDGESPPSPPAISGGGTGKPAGFVLRQNYPNPFNPVTTIGYEVPTGGRVTLRVYTILGQEVTTLVDEVQQAGQKSVRWDAGGVAGGIYLYRLKAGGFSETREMLLIR